MGVIQREFIKITPIRVQQNISSALMWTWARQRGENGRGGAVIERADGDGTV